MLNNQSSDDEVGPSSAIGAGLGGLGPADGESGVSAISGSNGVHCTLSPFEKLLFDVAEFHTTTSIVAGMGERVQILQQVEPELYRIGAIPSAFSQCQGTPPTTYTPYRRLMPSPLFPPELVPEFVQTVQVKTTKVAEATNQSIGRAATAIQNLLGVSPEVWQSAADVVSDIAGTLYNAAGEGLTWLAKRVDELREKVEENQEQAAELLAQGAPGQLLPTNDQLRRFQRSSVFDVISWRWRMQPVEATPNAASTPVSVVPGALALEQSLARTTGGLALRESWLQLASFLADRLCHHLLAPPKTELPPHYVVQQWSTWKKLLNKWSLELPANLASAAITVPLRHALVFVNTVPNMSFKQWTYVISKQPQGIFSLATEIPIVLLEKCLSDCAYAYTATGTRTLTTSLAQSAWRGFLYECFMRLVQCATPMVTPSDQGFEARTANESVYTEFRRTFANALAGAPSLRNKLQVRNNTHHTLYYRIDSTTDFGLLAWHIFLIAYWNRAVDTGLYISEEARRISYLPSQYRSEFAAAARDEGEDCARISAAFAAPRHGNVMAPPPATLPDLEFLARLQLNSEPQVEPQHAYGREWNPDASCDMATLIPTIPRRFLRLICALAIAATDAGVAPELMEAGRFVMREYLAMQSHSGQTPAAIASREEEVSPELKRLIYNTPFRYSPEQARFVCDSAYFTRLVARGMSYFVGSPGEHLLLFTLSELVSYPLKTLRYRVAVGIGLPRSVAYSTYLEAAARILVC